MKKLIYLVLARMSFLKHEQHFAIQRGRVGHAVALCPGHVVPFCPIAVFYAIHLLSQKYVGMGAKLF